MIVLQGQKIREEEEEEEEEDEEEDKDLHKDLIRITVVCSIEIIQHMINQDNYKI